jgi:hypothetical protein
MKNQSCNGHSCFALEQRARNRGVLYSFAGPASLMHAGKDTSQ